MKTEHKLVSVVDAIIKTLKKDGDLSRYRFVGNKDYSYETSRGDS